MERDARPLPPKAHSAMFDAAVEEVHQGMEKYGVSTLLDLFTGLRARVLVHFTDDWIEETDNGLQARIPKQVRCTRDFEGGCRRCNQDQTRGPDGFLRPKTGQGEQRVIPIPTTWYDTYKGEKRDTHLPEFLDHFFSFNETWGFGRDIFQGAVYRVASRRHDVIANSFEGEVERKVIDEREIVPWVTPHDLRASWCTQCLRMRVDDTTLMDWGGWKSAGMIDHYRSFVGDPTGSEREKIEGNSGDNVSAEAIIQVLAENGLLDTDAVDHDALEDLVDEL